MSHGNGRIYVDTSGISTNDVSDVLGVGSSDVGALCSSTEIKTFAKFKPIADGGPDGISATEAKANNYGLYVPYYTRISDMAADIYAGTWSRATNYDSSKNPFSYTRVAPPQWARLLDFDGYNHNCQAPYGQVYPHHKDIELWENVRFILPHMPEITGQLTKSDFCASNGSTILAQNMYLGLFVYCHNNFSPTGDMYSYITMDYTKYSEKFDIYRGLNANDDIIVACAFLSSVYTQGEVWDDKTLTGYFIPLTFSRGRFDDIRFESPYMNWLYDPISPFNPRGNGDMDFVWSLYPNGTFDFVGHINACDTSVNDIVTTGDFTAPLIMVKDDQEETMPIFVKVSTNRAAGTATVKTFAQSNRPGLQYVDVYDEVYQGNPLLPDHEETVEIESGSILTDPTAVSRVAQYLIDGQIGNDEYGYTAWGGAVPG